MREVFTTSAIDSRDFEQEDYRVRLDLRKQILALEVEPAGVRSEEDALHPTLVPTPWSRFVSASLLAQKAKQFDDGLYAAIELLPGKSQFLQTLVQELSIEPPDLALPLLLAARRLGGAPEAIPNQWQSAVSALLKDFLSNEKLSKPLGFYTWTDELAAVFRRDRLLQQPLAVHDAGSLVSALRRNSTLRSDYERLLRLSERLTNPFASPDFRSDDLTQAALFPPSSSLETDLMKRLYTGRSIPEGFNLMDELIARIRSGDVSMEPAPGAGWYSYQSWALDPLIRPERMPEARSLQLAPSYRRHLEELFKGLLALTRETHVKQVEGPTSGAAGPGSEPPVYVYPALSVEPLPSYYRRRAVGYQFLRGQLHEILGERSLSQMHRLTEEGPVLTAALDELRQMEDLFHGAYLVSMRELGLSTSVEGASETQESQFRRWQENLSEDADITRDARMMVPVFYDLERKQTKVWMLLGWSAIDLSVSFAQPPEVEVRDAAGKRLNPRILFEQANYSLAHPVMAEVYVNRLLNRTEFRAHCDRYRTPQAIIEHLTN